MVVNMKKRAALLSLALIASATQAFAGSIDYLSNQSADYVRMFSRNAATQGADIAMYNPAATAFVQDGLYLQYNHQTIFKTYTESYRGKDFKSDEPTWALPSGFGIYKKDKWAGFVTASAIAGGGRVDFKGGIPTHMQVAQVIPSQTPGITSAVLSDGDMKAMSFYPQLTLGGSYAINDAVSVALGVRGVYAYKSYKGKGIFTLTTALNTTMQTTKELDAKETAYGVGFVISEEIRPTKNLVIAARFESPIRLNFKSDVKNGDTAAYGGGMFTDNKHRRKDLPGMIGLGTSYVFFDRVTAIASFDGFLIGLSDQSTDVASKGIYNDGWDDDYDSFGYEASLGFDVAVIPDFLSLSFGYMYTKTGGNCDTYSDLEYPLDSNSYGIGGKVSPSKDLDVTLGLSHSRYFSSVNSKGVTYSKYNYIAAASVEYRFR